MLRLRILKHETLLHDLLLIIERQFIEESEAFGIDKDLDAAKIKYIVARVGLAIELDGVGQTGAAAASDA